MKRRSFERLRPDWQAEHHHRVYVVLLDPAVATLWRGQVDARDPAKPCAYLGMSGVTPEERMADHKRGDKASSLAKR